MWFDNGFCTKLDLDAGSDNGAHRNLQPGQWGDHAVAHVESEVARLHHIVGDEPYEAV